MSVKLSSVRPILRPLHGCGGFAAEGPAAARRFRSIAARPSLVSKCEPCRAVVKVDRRIRWHYTTTILRLRIGARLTRYRNCKFHNFSRTISRHADGISRYSVPPRAGPLLPLVSRCQRTQTCYTNEIISKYQTKTHYSVTFCTELPAEDKKHVNGLDFLKRSYAADLEKHNDTI